MEVQRQEAGVDRREVSMKFIGYPTSSPGLRVVAYYCPGCRQTLGRVVRKPALFHDSFCERTGRVVRCRRLRHQPPRNDIYRSSMSI